MVDLYPECWGTIVEGEEIMRLERIPQMLREKRGCSEAAAFQSLPLKLVWSKVSMVASKDREFWQ